MMPLQSPSHGLLVLVELGATWPRSVVEESAHSSRRVLVEVEGEGPAGFAARVASLQNSLFARGVSLKAVVLACNARADGVAVAARRRIARGLLERRSLARIVFSPPQNAGVAFRDALDALTRELSAQERSRASVGFARPESAPPATLSRVA
jgi:hypothetical protein